LDASCTDTAKARKLREFFQKHGRIFIVVDATAETVRVPEYLKGDPALRLVLSVRMPQAISFNDDALESELSFSGKPFPCHIPMRYIWASYVPEQGLDTGILWEADMPDSVRAVVSAARKLHESTSQDIAGTEHETAGGNDASDTVPAKRRIRHLRVVK